MTTRIKDHFIAHIFEGHQKLDANQSMELVGSPGNPLLLKVNVP